MNYNFIKTLFSQVNTQRFSIGYSSFVLLIIWLLSGERFYGLASFLPEKAFTERLALFCFLGLILSALYYLKVEKKIPTSMHSINQLCLAIGHIIMGAFGSIIVLGIFLFIIMAILFLIAPFISNALLLLLPLFLSIWTITPYDIALLIFMSVIFLSIFSLDSFAIIFALLFAVIFSGDLQASNFHGNETNVMIAFVVLFFGSLIVANGMIYLLNRTIATNRLFSNITRCLLLPGLSLLLIFFAETLAVNNEGKFALLFFLILPMTSVFFYWLSVKVGKLIKRKKISLAAFNYFLTSTLIAIAFMTTLWSVTNIINMIAELGGATEPFFQISEFIKNIQHSPIDSSVLWLYLLVLPIYSPLMELMYDKFQENKQQMPT